MPFFNKLRRSEIKTEGLKRYLLYAVGEIVLVMIGILLALEVSNWNDDRRTAKEELALLEEMKFNLENDLKDCIWNVAKNKDIHRSNTIVLRFLESQAPFHDSLRTHFGKILGRTTQRRNMSAYDNLKTKGMDLIQNQSLRRNITVIYSERYYYIEMKELEFDNQIQLYQVLPQVNEKLVVDQEQQTGYPINLVQLQKDDAFKGMLRSNIYVRWLMANIYEGIQTEMESLIKEIDTELKSRK